MEVATEVKENFLLRSDDCPLRCILHDTSFFCLFVNACSLVNQLPSSVCLEMIQRQSFVNTVLKLVRDISRRLFVNVIKKLIRDVIQ
jgi:hypothetical protein